MANLVSIKPYLISPIPIKILVRKDSNLKVTVLNI